MKKIFLVFSLCGILLSGCEKFLDTTDFTHQNVSNFPANPQEVEQLLTGVYNAAFFLENDDQATCSIMYSDILSDDCFAGGAGDDAKWQGLERFEVLDTEFTKSCWTAAYQTIYRANNLIESVDIADWGSDQAGRDYAAGQAHFFRAYAFFYIPRLWGPVPMPLKTSPENLPRAGADEVFAQIGLDFLRAIELMPSGTKRFGSDENNRMRATRWAAEAFLARAWLFYTGKYGKDSMPVAADGENAAGSISKADIIGHLEDCITNSGHDLLPKFGNLWPYSNTYTSNPDDDHADYKYAVDNELEWIDETGENVETVFGFACSPSQSGWGTGLNVDLVQRYTSLPRIPSGCRQSSRLLSFRTGLGILHRQSPVVGVIRSR